jgi:flagellar basal-body rod protein FlgB
MFGDFIPFINDVMDYSTTNRKVIADNISNFNTPDYKTKSLRFDQVLEKEMHLSLQTGDQKHISNQSSPMSIPNYQEVIESNGNARIDGNNVNTSAEMIKMLKNNFIFSTSVNAVNKEFSLHKLAIGR